MNISDINIYNIQKNKAYALKEPYFGHKKNENNYNFAQKTIVTGMTVAGVLSSLAILAKKSGYSLSPKKMFKNIKNSYLAKVDFEAKEVIAMGAGSCLGGLAGGYMVDKNKNNRRAKLRETVMQIGNVSVPILLVHFIVGKKFKNKSKIFKAFASLGCVGVGVPLSNIIMNTINSYIFDKGKPANRKIKVTDFSAHFDDVVVAANYISKAGWVRAIGRFVPAALAIPGLEVGNKTATNQI